MERVLKFSREGTDRLLQAEQVIERPLTDVFALFARPENLDALTPAFLKFRTLTPAPIKMHPGALIEHEIRMLGLPMRWRSRILEFDPPRRFVDFQESGPYALWHHTHRFEALDAQHTRVVDEVRYRMPLGPLGSIAHALFTRAMLTRIFAFRQVELEKRFPPLGARTTQGLQGAVEPAR
jgi:ligand-binding SRPBCC domain-containing protein